MDASADKLSAWSDMFQRLFDTSPAQVALVDLNGVIAQTNIAWRRFGLENGLSPAYDCVGKNYLEICEAAVSKNEPGARQACIGLLEVLKAQRPKFTLVYPCHSPIERRWYRMWVEPQTPKIPAIIVAHYLRQAEPWLDKPDQGSFHISTNPDSFFEAR